MKKAIQGIAKKLRTISSMKFTKDFYAKTGSLILGFHGCKEEVRDKIINSSTKHLFESKNFDDWLGWGIYFWLNDPIRAAEWVPDRYQSDKTMPAVIGAVIDIGECLDLSRRACIKQIQMSYEIVKKEFEIAQIPLPKNKVLDGGGFTLSRPLDCAVINRLHMVLADEGYQTVFGFFDEGVEAYEGAGFSEKGHAQICVRDKNCIKGYFLPREKASSI